MIPFHTILHCLFELRWRGPNAVLIRVIPWNQKATIQRNYKTALEILFFKNGVIEGDSEIEVEWKHHWQVQEEANDDNQYRLLLVIVSPSFTKKINW